MTAHLADELRAAAQELSAAAEAGNAVGVKDPLTRLESAASAVGAAWSGSPIGYHSRVYYNGMQKPPAGAHWSSEWGDYDAFSGGTTGEWREYTRQDVLARIRADAGEPPLKTAEAVSAAARRTLASAQAEIASILTAYLGGRADPLIQELKDRAGQTRAATAGEYARATLPNSALLAAR